MTETLWYLKQCRLFEQLTPSQIARLEACSRMRSFPRNSPVYLPADDASAVFLLARGQAKICHLTADGKESILAFVRPGELFGELAILESGERGEYVETLAPSTVVMIPSSELHQLMAELPGMSLGITKLIGLRRRRIERRLKNLLFLPNRERLVHLLLDLVEEYGEPAERGIALGIKLSHQELASVIGSTRETVTVVLGQLRDDGVVHIGRKRLTILQPERLAASVNRTAPLLRASTQPLRPAFGSL